MTTRLSKAAYVILYTNKMNDSVSYYRNTLGLKLKAESPFWSEFDAGGFTLALHACDDKPSKQSETSPNIVFEVKNFETAVKGLAKQGVAFTSPVHEVCSDGKRSGVSCNFTDPSGNHLSIFGWVKALKAHQHGEHCNH
ncbi:MAG: VOC family protein [Planctomycetota bacterium]